MRILLRPSILLAVLLTCAAAWGVLALHSSVAAQEAPSSANPIVKVPDGQIGRSALGEPLDVGCYGEGDRTALLIGGLHTGSESVTVDLAVEMVRRIWTGRVEIPAGVRICVLPVLNPDGLAHGLHTNGNRVDLNRNWPTGDWRADAWHPETGPVSGGDQALSEPETQALYNYISSTDPDLVVVWHCCGSLVEANEQRMAVVAARRYAWAAGFGYLDDWNYYPISGEFIDAMDVLKVPAIDVELARTDDIGIDEHVAGLVAALQYLAFGER
jgi:hypothetical protein